MPCGTTRLVSSVPQGAEDKDPLGFHSERWQPLAMLWTRSTQVSVGG